MYALVVHAPDEVEIRDPREEAYGDFVRELGKVIKQANRSWWDAWLDRVGVCLLFILALVVYAKGAEWSGGLIPHVDPVGVTIVGIIGVFIIFALMGRHQDSVVKREQRKINDLLKKNAGLWHMVASRRPELREKVNQFFA